MIVKHRVTYIIVAFLVSTTGCKPRRDVSTLKDISSMQEVQIEIPEGRIFYNGAEDSIGGIGVSCLDTCTKTNGSTNDTIDIKKAARDLNRQLQAEFAIYVKHGSESIEEDREDLGLLSKIYYTINSQLYYLGRSLNPNAESSYSLVESEIQNSSTAETFDIDSIRISAKNFDMKNLQVMLDHPGMIIDSRTGGKDAYLSIRYSLVAKGMIPADKKLTKRIVAEGYVPHSSNSHFLDTAKKHLASCIDNSSGNEIDTYNFFYYLKPSMCNFAQLNAGDKFFTKTKMTITPIAGTHDATPVHERIWEDDRLVATYVFGKYDSGAKVMDHGTVAYADFLRRLKNVRGLTFVDENVISPYNRRLRGTIKTDFITKPKTFDIQVIHVDKIDNITPEDSQAIFGERIGASDLFMYNGHSGYGQNIKYIQQLVKPEPNQYVLFYLNGCNTYEYSASKAPNFDFITNAEATYFNDMANASIAILEGIINGKTYRQIISTIPSRGCPVVSGKPSGASQ